MAAVEGREGVRADRPDAGRVRRRVDRRAVRQGGAAVRAGERRGPADHGGRDGDAAGILHRQRRRRRAAPGPEAAAALLAQGGGDDGDQQQRRRRRRVGAADADAVHHVVQHQRPHHHLHPRGQVI